MKQYFIKYNDFLNESLSSARKKYLDTGLIYPDEFSFLESKDPTPTKKYLEKMCEWYVNEDADAPSEVANYIQMFHLLLSKIKQKDINKYGSFEEFKEMLDGIESNTAKKKEITKGIKVVFENEDVQVTNPRTYEQSCILGMGTRWCTTSAGSTSHWDKYVLDDRLTFYYIWFKKEEDRRFYKVAVAVNKSNKITLIYDAEDKQMTRPDLDEMLMAYNVPMDIFVSDVIPMSKYKKIEYYSIGDNVIKSTYEEDAQGKGEFREYYFDGELEGHYFYNNNGKLEGEYKKWYTDGAPWIHCFYNNGKLEGEYKKWSPNGNRFLEHLFYKNGKVIKDYLTSSDQ